MSDALKPLFSLADLSLKGRASAFHYRTLVGRLNLWGLLLFSFCMMALYLLGFPLVEFVKAIMTEDNATINGIVDSIKNLEIGVFILASVIAMYLFIISVGAMIMRLHDFGRSGWWVILIVALPSLLDTFFIEVMGIISYGWIGFIVTLALLYKNGDFAKNHYGYDDEPDLCFSKPLYLISFLPVTFLLLDVLFSFLM